MPITNCETNNIIILGERKMIRNGFRRIAKELHKLAKSNQFTDEDEHYFMHLISSAGKLMHKMLEQGTLINGKIPSYLRSEPVSKRIACSPGNKPKKVSFYMWDTYWCVALDWLSGQRPDIPVNIPHHFKCLGKPPIWAPLSWCMTRALAKGYFKKYRLDFWCELAKKSAKCCYILSNIRPKLDLHYSRVFACDGNYYDLTATEFNMLEVLFKAQGGWVAGRKLECDRASKIKKNMQPAVAKMIESHSRSGYRIPSLLPQ